MHIIGTAGHVDHGKSSLVAALTGTNPDRWIEEQLRGMTLDLGFAHLRFDDGSEAGIVDVPGHARFLHNMLAGAAGMELLLLVVAADDGVMPQTIEHLQILQYLNARRVLVALSKIDLIEPDRVPDAIERVREQLRGTIAEDAEIIPVSTLTGVHLPDLKAALARELAQIAARDADAPVYLPVDRVFTLAGRGTIVTGTLMQGAVSVGDTLTLEPQALAVRVRGVQVFGEARQRVEPGTRVALNLTGVDRSAASRGAVLASESAGARTEFSVTFQPVDDAVELLRRRTHVRAYIGAAEVLGTLVFPRVPVAGERVEAQLFLREPVHAFPGVRFVVRRVSPKTLLGGGEIGGGGVAAVATDGEHHHDETILALLAARGIEPMDAAALAFAANIREELARERLAALIERGDVAALARPVAYLASAPLRDFGAQIAARLNEAHAAEPWAMGLTSLALARALGMPEPALVRLLAALVEEGAIASRQGYYFSVGHTPRLSPEQRAFFERTVPDDPAQAFVPVALEGVLAHIKSSKIEGLVKAFDTLQARGVLVNVAGELYRGTQIQRAHELIERFIGEHGSMTMAQFRDVIGTSRKYAVPLLEWFDSRGITVRSGDLRMLRRKGASERSV
jgi:selenocysteine-specific elongation factor